MVFFQLFLGFPLDKLFVEELGKANPYLVAQFIQTGREAYSADSEYLREIIYQEMHFLGKFLGGIANLQHIELVEANIYSLLKRLVPHFSYEEIPLYLFPIDISDGPG
ncbi:MAG: hypothetical protein WB791_10105 [Waddliaceae bacterium]